MTFAGVARSRTTDGAICENAGRAGGAIASWQEELKTGNGHMRGTLATLHPQDSTVGTNEGFRTSVGIVRYEHAGRRKK